MKQEENIENKIKELLANVIHSSYVPTDELDTRFNILNKINELIENCASEQEKYAFEKTLEVANGLSFEEIKHIYDLGAEGIINREILLDNETQSQLDEKEEETMTSNKENGLFDLVFNNSKKEVCAYINGEDAMNFKVIKTFNFENEHYVILEDYENKQQKYYRYNIDEDSNESMVAVEEPLLLRVFNELGY